MVFDVTNRKTFSSVPYWIDTLRQNASHSGVQIILLGNKLDIVGEGTILSKKAASIASDHFKCFYIEASAKDDLNVNKAFATIVELILKKIEELGIGNNIKRRNSSISMSRRKSCTLNVKQPESPRRFSEPSITDFENKKCMIVQKDKFDKASFQGTKKRTKQCVIS